MKILFIDHHNGFSGGQKSLLKLLLYSSQNDNIDFKILIDERKGEFFEQLESNGLSEFVIQERLNSVDSRASSESNIAHEPLRLVRNVFLFSTLYRIRKLVVELQFDVVYMNSFKAGILGVLALLFLSKIKRCFRIRTALDYQSHGWIDKVIFSESDLLLANSHYIKSTVDRKWWDKTVVSYNYSEKIGDPYVINYRRQLRLLIVGRITERKRTHEIVDLLEKFHGLNIMCTILGTAERKDNDYATLLKKRVSALGLESMIIFHDFVDDVYSVMREHDCILLPSVKEPLSRVIIESLSIGMPVITTNDSGNRELIESGVNGWLYDPGDLYALKSIIDRITVDRLVNISRKALITYETRLTLEHTLKKELKIMEGE